MSQSPPNCSSYISPHNSYLVRPNHISIPSWIFSCMFIYSLYCVHVTIHGELFFLYHTQQLISSASHPSPKSSADYPFISISSLHLVHPTHVTMLIEFIFLHPTYNSYLVCLNHIANDLQIMLCISISSLHLVCPIHVTIPDKFFFLRSTHNSYLPRPN